MLNMDPSAIMWRKSSFSATGNCIEVAVQDESVVLIRDSKNRNGAILSVSSSAWREFIQAVRHNSAT